MNKKLMEAVAVFKELGWEKAAPDNVLALPLGTREQKKVLLDGLSSGAWGEISRLTENTYGWKSYIDVDEHSLALLALRVGVNARRAVSILLNINMQNPVLTVLAEVICGRGEKFASDFIKYGCVSRYRMHEHSGSRFGKLAVYLVDRLNLDIPQTVDYIKDWSVYAAAALGLPAETLYKETNLPDIEVIKRRFAEHIKVGAAVNAPATGPFGKLLPKGVMDGYLPYEEAVGLVFSALDAAVRPGDRKVWIQVLFEIGVSGQQLCARIQMLIPLLSSGAPAVIEPIAPVLIAGADSGLLGEVLIASLSSSAKKTKQLVLRCAMERPCPQNADALSLLLSALARDKDKKTAALAAGLMKQWNLKGREWEEPLADAKNLWQPTPPVWKLPVFHIGEVSGEALTDLAAEMAGRSAFIHDMPFERFLAMANAAAFRNPREARISLAGLGTRHEGLYQISCWAGQREPDYGFDSERDGTAGTQQLLPARDYAVCSRLDKLPCLLSTPSMADLTISAADLAKRLVLYQKTNTIALEADLFLAMTRLDITTKTPEALGELGNINVPVVLQTNEIMKKTAGQYVLDYMEDVISEPEPMPSGWRQEISVSKALEEFPPRLESYYGCELFSIFPTWGDRALEAVHWSGEVYHEQGLVMRQAARRKAPLPPGASINFLAARRSSSPKAAQDAMLAVREVWERGLLRPGAADIDLLDWSREFPSNLAALAGAFEELAQEGLLSVVWPVIDSLIEKSLKAPRLLAGTPELVRLAAQLLPQVRLAVQKGLAEPSSLNLPGIRSLAKRGGTSIAAAAAKEIAALLPELQEDVHEIAADVLPFTDVWRIQRNTAPLIEDGVTITAEPSCPEYKRKLLNFVLTLPQIEDKSFVIEKEWFYDLEHERQCLAYEVPRGKIVNQYREKPVYLYWDMEKKAMAVSEYRNRTDNSEGPLKGVFPLPPLPVSILTVLIGLTAQDGEAEYFAPRLIRQFVEKGMIGVDVVYKAASALLQSPAVSPAKLMRVLEQDVTLLSVMWPLLTECIKYAGRAAAAGQTPPVWVNRVLDISLRYTPYLKEAAEGGYIPAEAVKWKGLLEIASSKARSASVVKARKLLELWKSGKAGA